MTGPDRVAGAVLTGGASSRFGSDKTVAELGGRALVDRVAAALRAGGADPVAAVGGRGGGTGGVEVVAVADEHPGEGPLGGLLTALAWSPAAHTVVVAADLPLLDELTVRAVAERATRCPGTVAVVRAGGRLQPTCACWPAQALDPLRARFDAGERSIARTLDEMAVEPVDVPDLVVADVDTREDLARLAVVWSR